MRSSRNWASHADWEPREPGAREDQEPAHVRCVVAPRVRRIQKQLQTAREAGQPGRA